jgi:hypothetical protein
MANGDSKSVCSVGLREFAKSKQDADHFLHLCLVGSAVTHKSFLDLQWRILGDSEVSI